LSIPTCLAHAQWLVQWWRAIAPPGWLVWLSTPRDPPLLVLLVLVLLAFGLGLAARRR
jgi:hypothetical protein